MSRQIFFFVSHCFTHIPRSFDKFIKFFDSYSHLIVCLIILRNLYTSLGEYNNRAIKLNYALNYLINCKLQSNFASNRVLQFQKKKFLFLKKQDSVGNRILDLDYDMRTLSLEGSMSNEKSVALHT